MCIIAVKQKNVGLPKEEELRSCASTNRDGIGIVYHQNGFNTIKKDFVDVDSLITFLRENIRVEDSAIIHFRIGTCGLKDEGNRHPYPLSKDEKTLREVNLVVDYAVAHNGVLTQYSGRDEGILNDTQKFIQDILSEDIVKYNLKNPCIKKLIEKYISTDKLAFMLPDGEILTFGNFNESNGIMYSNFSFRVTTYPRHVHYGFGCGSEYGYAKDYLPKKPKEDKFCEGCGKMEKDLDPKINGEIKNLRYKKVRLSLCKPCRRELFCKKLESLYETKLKKVEEINQIIKGNSLIVADKTRLWTRCVKCGKYQDTNKCVNYSFGVYVCLECEELDKKLEEDRRKNASPTTPDVIIDEAQLGLIDF